MTEIVTIRRKNPGSQTFDIVTPSGHQFVLLSKRRERRDYHLPIDVYSLERMQNQLPSKLQLAKNSGELRDQTHRIINQFMRCVILPLSGLDREWEVEYPLMDDFQDAPPRIKDLE